MNLKKIFEPQTVAIVGISTTNHFHPANIIYNKNKLRYEARTYAVNPAGGELYGDKVFSSVKEIPEKVDVAVLSIRAEYIPNAVKECIDAGVGGAVIISGGFTEIGRSDLQDEIIRLAMENNFPIIGPNCLGVFSPPFMDTFFLSNERLVKLNKGSISLISQSGGILVDQLIKLTQEGGGFSKAISVGNKAVIDEVAVLDYLIKNENTSVIGLYLEGFKSDRGRDFIEAVNSSKKPVVILKSGKTPGGSRAVSSHTAAIAGDYAVFSELIKSCKAIEATNEFEFVSYCEVLSIYPEVEIKNVCIITASGGHGAIASDGCFREGIAIPEVSESDKSALREKLSKSIQGIASLSNPIDLTGSAKDDDFYYSAKFFLEKNNIDCIILLLLPYLPGVTSDIGARIAQLAKEYNKPFITYMPHVDKYGIFIDGFESNGIPVAHSVEGAVYMAKALKRKEQ